MRSGSYWYKPNFNDPTPLKVGEWIQIEVFQAFVLVMGSADHLQLLQLKGEFKRLPLPNEYEEYVPWSREPGPIKPARPPYTGPRRLLIEE